MKLYHYTTRLYLPSIWQIGIYKGDVPTSLFGGFNAPWLTSNPSWNEQLWGRGGSTGILIDGVPAIYPDKREVRIIVNVPEGDSNLHHWPELAARLQIEEDFLQILERTGGGSANHWYIYDGVIPASWFESVERRPKRSERRAQLQRAA